MKKLVFDLSSALKQRKITQRKLAEMLNLPEQNVGQWVLGKRIPRLDTFLHICECLDCTPNDLIVLD